MVKLQNLRDLAVYFVDSYVPQYIKQGLAGNWY